MFVRAGKKRLSFSSFSFFFFFCLTMREHNCPPSILSWLSAESIFPPIYFFSFPPVLRVYSMHPACSINTYSIRYLGGKAHTHNMPRFLGRDRGEWRVEGRIVLRQGKKIGRHIMIRLPLLRRGAVHSSTITTVTTPITTPYCYCHHYC